MSDEKERKEKEEQEAIVRTCTTADCPRRSQKSCWESETGSKREGVHLERSWIYRNRTFRGEYD